LPSKEPLLIASSISCDGCPRPTSPPRPAGAARTGAPPGQARRLAFGVESTGSRDLAKHQLPAASDLFGRTGTDWLRNAPLELVYRQRIDSLLELIDAYDGEIEVFRTMIANRFAGHRGYQVIQQISGVGPTFAVVFVAEFGDIARFARPEKLCCWAGLTPRHRESDTLGLASRLGTITIALQARRPPADAEGHTGLAEGASWVGWGA
jgi:transposase